jgi:2,3-bisphosphoglycerate-independent phosphoglycerate mutase
VPVVAVADGVDTVRDGILADVAPTLLRLMGVDAPEEMTGTCLV